MVHLVFLLVCLLAGILVPKRLTPAPDTVAAHGEAAVALAETAQDRGRETLGHWGWSGRHRRSHRQRGGRLGKRGRSR